MKDMSRDLIGKIDDKRHELIGKWEEMSQNFIGSFVELFGRDGRIVSINLLINVQYIENFDY